MQEANFINLFRNIIFIVGFYYAFKFLARIFLPILMNKAVHKVQQNFEKQQSQYSSDTNSGSETSNQSNKFGRKPTKQVGEYIDYEEVD
jgi:hypothetical protein